MKNWKCSVCGKAFYASDVSNAKRHVHGTGKCKMAGAVLHGVSVIFRPSDRLVGGRESVIDMPESISRLEPSALSPDHPIEDTSLIYTDDLEETDQHDAISTHGANGKKFLKTAFSETECRFENSESN